jgi:hypothetical protein
MHKRELFVGTTKLTLQLCKDVHNIAQYTFVCVCVCIHTNSFESELFPTKSVQQKQHADVAGCRTFFNGLVACLSSMLCRSLVDALHPLELPWLWACCQIQPRSFAQSPYLQFFFFYKAKPCYRCQRQARS